MAARRCIGRSSCRWAAPTAAMGDAVVTWAGRTRAARGSARLGWPGGSRESALELKSVADVGLIGFPSAGKSSLVSVLSAARPTAADYPFATLVPNLGVATAGERVFT